MRQKENKHHDDRLKPNPVNNHIKCKCLSTPLKGRDMQLDGTARPNYMLPIRNAF